MHRSNWSRSPKDERHCKYAQQGSTVKRQSWPSSVVSSQEPYRGFAAANTEHLQKKNLWAPTSASQRKLKWLLDGTGFCSYSAMLILGARAQAFSIFQKSETKQIKTESLSWNSAYIAIIPEKYFDKFCGIPVNNFGKQFRKCLPINLRLAVSTFTSCENEHNCLPSWQKHLNERNSAECEWFDYFMQISASASFWALQNENLEHHDRCCCWSRKRASVFGSVFGSNRWDHAQGQHSTESDLVFKTVVIPALAIEIVCCSMASWIATPERVRC